jgi:hypothetical protein
MPAESKKQQRFFGMVHAVQKGDLSPSEVGPAVRKAAKNTEYSDAKDFASTKHKNLPEKKGSLQMKYFEKNAATVGLTDAENRRIANRATREGNLILTSPEFRRRAEKEDKRNPPISTKYTIPYALKGTGIGAGTGVLAGAGYAALNRIKKLKGIGKALGIGVAGGAYLGATLGASIGGQRDFEDELEMAWTNFDRAEKKYLAQKGIKAKVGINHATTYKASPEAINRYLTNYNRKKIKAER